MSGTEGRSRQPRGVPTGGEFATEAKTEGPDLDATTDPMVGVHLRRGNQNNWTVFHKGYDGFPLYVRTRGDDFGPQWGEENELILRKLRAAGVHGELVVFERNQYGSWLGYTALPNGKSLVVQSGGDLGETVMASVHDRPVDSEQAAYGSDEEQPLGEVMKHLLFSADVVNRLRSKYPLGRISCSWQASKRHRILIQAANGVGVNFDESTSEGSGRGNWYPADRILPRGMSHQDAWDFAAEAVDEGGWLSLSAAFQNAGEDARAGSNMAWLQDGLRH